MCVLLFDLFTGTIVENNAGKLGVAVLAMK